MRYPGLLLDRPIADPLVAGDHDELSTADHLEPHVVLGLTWDFRQAQVTGVDDVSVECGERLSERQVVLVDEEPGHHWLLRRQRAELFLVGDGGLDVVDAELIGIRDLIEGFAGVVELPQPLGRNTGDSRLAESNEWIDCHG